MLTVQGRKGTGHPSDPAILPVEATPPMMRNSRMNSALKFSEASPRISQKTFTIAPIEAEVMLVDHKLTIFLKAPMDQPTDRNSDKTIIITTVVTTRMMSLLPFARKRSLAVNNTNKTCICIRLATIPPNPAIHMYLINTKKRISVK